MINFWDNNDPNQKFDVFINNVQIEPYKEINNTSIKSSGIYFQIPEQLIQSKNNATIKIHSDTYSGKVFDLRILKQDFDFSKLPNSG